MGRGPGKSRLWGHLASEEDFESNKPATDASGTLCVEHFDFTFLVHFGLRSPPRKHFPA